MAIKDNQVEIEKCIKQLISLLGDNPDREGLKDTPKRVAKMYAEVFEGMDYTNEDIAKMFDKCFEVVDCNDLVVIKDISIFSYCEHHLALMYDMKVSVGYIPNGKVIGLSKVARIAEMCGKRLQLQERIGQDIYEVLKQILNTEDIAITITGKHSCMTARGIKNQSAVTNTAVMHGEFRFNDVLRKEFYDLCK